MQDVPNETPPEVRQTTSIVDGKVFVTTEKVQKDVNGVEFVVFRTLPQPYQGSIEDYKSELEAAKTKQIERHTAVISDIDAKIADATAKLPK